MRVFLLLLALWAVAFGANHIDSTSVSLEEASAPNGEHFLVAVQHSETALAEDGTPLAERDVRVALHFDIQQNQVVVNEVPVSLGDSEIEILAQVTEVDAEGVQHPFDELVAVKVRIYVEARPVTLPNGEAAYGIAIQERVLGIQSNEVWQANVMEQVLLLNANGEVQRMEAIQIEALQSEVQPGGGEGHHHGPHGQGHHGQGHHGQGHHGQGHHGQGHHGKPQGADDQPEMGMPMDVEGQAPQDLSNDMVEPQHQCIVSVYFHEALNRFHQLPFFLRLIISFFGGILMGMTGMCILKALCSCCSKKKCCTQAQAPSYKENIRVYSLQYTAVPQDEKKPEKQTAEQQV